MEQQQFEKSGNVFKTIVAMVITVVLMLAVKKVGDQDVSGKSVTPVETGLTDIAGNK